jgi:hypothetical protein
MGPLLAGNVINGSPVWHMEHCGRISTFGSALGPRLAGALVAEALSADGRASVDAMPTS